MNAQDLAVEMERALLGCTTHISGVVLMWNQCRDNSSDEELHEIGRILLQRSADRAVIAKETESQRSLQRERMIAPFVRALFAPNDDS